MRKLTLLFCSFWVLSFVYSQSHTIPILVGEIPMIQKDTTIVLKGYEYYELKNRNEQEILLFLNKDGKTMGKITPPVWENIDTILIEKEKHLWQKGKIDAGCLSANPCDCRMMYLMQFHSAIYVKNVKRKKLVKPAYLHLYTDKCEKLQAIYPPSPYLEVKKVIEDSVIQYAYTRENWSFEELSKVPTIKVIINKPAPYCSIGYMYFTIEMLGKLINKGYLRSDGASHLIFTPIELDALERFQEDHHLPSGFNEETITALGIEW